jgi:organic radical activating enzyme
MANLSITNNCNKNCVYCFAGDTLDEFGITQMNTTVFEKALDYLDRSGLKQVRLMGGEPTLHPDFTLFASKALERDFNILLFTNGLINNRILKFLEEIPENNLDILLNTIHPNENNQQGIVRQKHTMKILGNRIAAGINLYSNNQDFDYLLDYVTQFGLKKEIRLGISHSVLSRKNTFLHPKEYKSIGYKIALFKLEAKKHGITLGFDCGFVPCMFPEEYFELLNDELQKAGNCCHPIIDLLANCTFISCYPLNNFYKINLDDKITAKDLNLLFDKRLVPYKEAGIFPYCTSCPLFNNRCNGGCMSFRMQRFDKLERINSL